MRILCPDGYRVQPWKNGLGKTTELATASSQDGAQGFAWRLSIAEVTADGAFSLFPNIDRVITVIEGEGMVLDAGVEGRHELEPLKPFSFPGEWQVEGQLKSGPVRDFNLMVDRRYGVGLVTVHDLATGPLALANQDALRFCHLLTGEARMDGLAIAACQTLLLERGDSTATLGGTGIALCGEITLGM